MRRDVSVHHLFDYWVCQLHRLARIDGGCVLRQGQNLDGSRLADGSEAQSAAQTSNAVLA